MNFPNQVVFDFAGEPEDMEVAGERPGRYHDSATRSENTSRERRKVSSRNTANPVLKLLRGGLNATRSSDDTPSLTDGAERELDNFLDQERERLLRRASDIAQDGGYTRIDRPHIVRGRDEMAAARTKSRGWLIWTCGTLAGVISNQMVDFLKITPLGQLGSLLLVCSLLLVLALAWKVVV